MARVLVIDDEPDVRWLIRMSLERAGHQVLVAEDGLRGVAVAMKQRPEVIVLDLMMPVMDGATFIAAKNRDSRVADIPIIVVTAAGRADVEGVAAVMRKPFLLDDFLDVVSRCVATSAA